MYMHAGRRHGQVLGCVLVDMYTCPSAGGRPSMPKRLAPNATRTLHPPAAVPPEPCVDPCWPAPCAPQVWPWSLLIPWFHKDMQQRVGASGATRRMRVCAEGWGAGWTGVSGRGCLCEQRMLLVWHPCGARAAQCHTCVENSACS
eukprot:346405-Chlamydomonas_euryale.AAC.1